MWWWPEHFRFPSSKNGSILVQRWLGKTTLFVNGFDQSSGYITRMWAKAFGKLPTSLPVNRILVLGLAGASSIRLLAKRFPQAQITVIEWDPVMITIANQYKVLKGLPPVTVIAGDAVEVVPTFHRCFDLIVVDLFTGDRDEPRLASLAMLQALAQALTPTGLLLLNAFKNTSLLARFAESFQQLQTWRYKYNQLGLYRQK